VLLWRHRGTPVRPLARPGGGLGRGTLLVIRDPRLRAGLLFGGPRLEPALFGGQLRDPLRPLRPGLLLAGGGSSPPNRTSSASSAARAASIHAATSASSSCSSSLTSSSSCSAVALAAIDAFALTLVPSPAVTSTRTSPSFAHATSEATSRPLTAFSWRRTNRAFVA
jgi:hypothetical protein